MKQRSKSIKNTTMLLCKGKKKQLYNNNQPPSCLPISTSVDLSSKINPGANNFVLANKKNLHNFFKDRIPQDKIVMGEKAPTFSPSRIFKLRRQQKQKQQTTKIRLQQSFDVENQIYRTPSTKKMKKTFQFNQKTKQISLQSISQTSKNFKLQSVASTYQTPTSSSMVKRCQTVKKQAYISVFGDKLIQEKSRMLEIQSATNLTLYQNSSAELKVSKQKPRPKTNLENLKLSEQKQKLGKLLEKIEGFASFVNPYRLKNSHIFQKRHNPEQKTISSFQNNQLEKNQLLGWVKVISNQYKQKNLAFKMNRMKTLEDLQKMDPSYYSKMKMHKNGRLWVRNKALNGINLDQSSKKIQNNIHDYFKINDYDSRNEDFLDQLLTITDRNNNTLDFQKQEKKTMCPVTQKGQTKKQKLAQFGRNLIKTAHLAKLFSIKSDQIYISLWKKRKPYELEGSYAFYKYIKHNNVQLVKSFIQKNQQYAHQLDHEERTPLIYAVQNNSTDVVAYLVKIGINVDAKTVKGHTALSYAIANNNYEAAEYLLKAGASPWSNQYQQLNIYLNKAINKIKILVKNARRIHLARSLMRKFKSKDIFWELYKNKINGDELITFS